jgi:hypothetical protein
VTYAGRVQGRTFVTALMASAVLAAPAVAQDPADTKVDFTLGRVPHTVPDKMDRIGIRSTCAEAGGCTIEYALKHGATFLGGGQFMLIGNTTETDNVTLSRRTAATLRKRRWVVTITAKVHDLAGNEATYTKVVTLGPRKKR